MTSYTSGPTELPEDIDEPLRWLFTKQGRLELVVWALNEVRGGDPVYGNKTYIAEQSGVSRHTVHRHLEELVVLDIFDVRRENITKYRPNEYSRMLELLGAIDSILDERFGEGLVD